MSVNPEALVAQAMVLAETYLRDRCAVQGLTTTNDGRGGFTEGWNDIESDIPVLVEAADDEESVIAQAPRGIVTHRLYLKVTSTTKLIEPSQRIVVATRDGKSQMLFEQPKRLDETYEALITVAATLNVSSPDETE
jgi:head-tail adaptor